MAMGLMIGSFSTRANSPAAILRCAGSAGK
jgi:hypothetical protein